ncbi:peptidyl-prolyl cis-trans isomerase FKBP8-like [Diadema antillarum]|uniref:peptidyl-prolyl cis-trans isomerase FKBP8-like n=1 Tax=Diadema antillarum TaxID=105358 RepID=UPI003A87C85C
MADESKQDEMETKGSDSVVAEEVTASDDRIEDLLPDVGSATQTDVDGSHVSKAAEPDEKGDHGKEDEPAKEDEDEWLDVLGSGQLMKKVLKEGKGESSRPERGASATVRMLARLEDGTEVEQHDRFTFTQGDGEVLQAVDLCVCLMELGEIAEIRSNSRFAYSEFGKEPLVPPNTDMVFEVELLETNLPPSAATMTIEECCEVADKKREYGNELFGRRDYSGAINSYTRALKFLEDVPASSGESKEHQLNDVLIKCHNNLAAAQLKVEAYSAALKSCNAALELDANNLKALFRKGKVLACQKEFKEAISMMKKALALEPANKTIHQELAKLTVRQDQEMQSEKAMYQRMVGDMAGASAEKPAGKKLFNAQTVLIGLSIVIVIVAVVVALHLT